jgi:hypothetical protein
VFIASLVADFNLPRKDDMNDPRQVAAGVVGAVDWQTEVSGFCRCPGDALHTHPTGKKDCRVNVDGAPTIFCFHASCVPAVAEANRRLRRELSATPWALTLPGAGVKHLQEMFRPRIEQRHVADQREGLVFHCRHIAIVRFAVFRGRYLGHDKAPRSFGGVGVGDAEIRERDLPIEDRQPEGFVFGVEQRASLGRIFRFEALLFSRLCVLAIVRAVGSPIEDEPLFYASPFLSR